MKNANHSSSITLSTSSAMGSASTAVSTLPVSIEPLPTALPQNPNSISAAHSLMSSTTASINSEANHSPPPMVGILHHSNNKMKENSKHLKQAYDTANSVQTPIDTPTKKKFSNIGFVDMADVLNCTPVALSPTVLIEGEFQHRYERISFMKLNLESDIDNIKKTITLSEAEKRKLISQLKTNITDEESKISQERTTINNEALRMFFKVAKDSIKQIAMEQGFDCIFTLESAVYCSDEVNITNKVIELCNSKYAFKNAAHIKTTAADCS